MLKNLQMFDRVLNTSKWAAELLGFVFNFALPKVNKDTEKVQKAEFTI